MKDPDKKLRLLRLATSACCSSIWEKFGNFRMFEQDWIEGLSEFNLRVYPNGTFNGFFKYADNFMIYEISRNGIFKVLLPLLLFFKAAYLIRKFKINVVHSNDIYFFGLPLLVAAKLCGKPFCVSIHANHKKRNELDSAFIPHFMGLSFPAKWSERIIYRYADLVLPIRDSIAEEIISPSCPERKIRIFPHVFDFDDFDKLERPDVKTLYGIPENASLIVHAGRLARDNYASDIADIAIKVCESDDKAYFILCGTGPEEKTMKDKVKVAGFEDRILFPGNVSNDIVFELRKQCSVNLCLMAGFSLIEACAGGRPVISYNVEWHHELVKDNETGFLLMENDTGAVIEKIRYILDNPEKAATMGRRARELAVERHSPQNVNKIKSEIYRELLAL
ncbi:MAG: hypothetical protein A2017_14830 [Lentisphaerae bacterium GWF2_44_16]|nr:MAG: hypothetical protein A2017_14830 [Lentisphaerae bacterium GWF2_44_16]